MNFWVSVISRYLWYRDLGICDHLVCLKEAWFRGVYWWGGRQ